VKPAQLQTLCDEWSQALGLGSWSIHARFTSHPPEADRGCALTEYSTTTRDAEITVLRFKYRDRKQLLTRSDYEVDLVHELLHLHTDLWVNLKPGSVRWIKREQFIESTARALVDMKRRAAGKCAA